MTTHSHDQDRSHSSDIFATIMLGIMVLAAWVSVGGYKGFLDAMKTVAPIVDTIAKYEPAIVSAARAAGLPTDAPELQQLRDSLKRLETAQSDETKVLAQKIPSTNGGEACPDFNALTKAMEANSKAQIAALEAFKRLAPPDISGAEGAAPRPSSTSTSSTSGEATSTSGDQKDGG